MLKIKTSNPNCAFIALGLWLMVAISWVINLIQLIFCNFEAPYKEEAIHIIGLIPPCSLVTCWF